jgi:hypothetical protein
MRRLSLHSVLLIVCFISVSAGAGGAISLASEWKCKDSAPLSKIRHPAADDGQQFQ